MNCVEDDHALGHFGRIIAKFAAACIAAPDFENGCFHSMKR
jgi:hypothetical protein